MPVAPGHTGTLGAVPLYLLLRGHGPGAVAAAAAVLTAIGIWASGRVARRLGGKDPQIVVIDEVAGVLVTWVAAPSTWAGLIVGGLLFRLLDQVKPWPARAAERRLPGGWGIMLDDVFAGGWGAALLLAARTLGWL
jgi:phosphatidylglycerophosphatase A